MFFPLRWEMQKLVGGNLEILAVNLGPSYLIGPSLPCRRPFGSLRNNPPQRTSAWLLRGRLVEGKANPIPSICKTQFGSGNDFACRAQGSAGNYKRYRRLPTADVHFVNFRFEDCYTLGLAKKQSTRRLLEYVIQANVKTNKIVWEFKTTRVREDTDISCLSELEVT